MVVMQRPSFAILGLLLLFLIFEEVKAEENYGCPAGWDFGSACGQNNCYRIVSIPPATRPRSVDDNFCAQFDKEAMPAVIRCEEENSVVIPSLPKYDYFIAKTGLEIGIYIPAHVPWGRNKFVNRDGSKVEYTKWGFISHILGGRREPGPGDGGGEKVTMIHSFKRPLVVEYTWHDVAPEHLKNLLCKRPAVLQPPKKLLPAVVKDEQDGEYFCPPGFDLGNVCGGHFCYRVVSVPVAKRGRMIDDNFCSEFEKDAMPAVIRCKEENDFVVTVSDNADIAENSGFALGLYIPVPKPWNPNSFVTYDGSKIEYLNWGLFESGNLPYKEPNGFLNGYPERIVNYHRFREGNDYINTWHDVGDPAAPHLLCRTTAKFKPTSPAAVQDEFSTYSCPEDWILGNVCGHHNCYKIVNVPANKRARVIDDNYCGEIDKRSIPAIIRCDEENEFLSTPPFAPTAIQSGFALGLYIPANKPWSSNGFINYDGSKVEYLKWGIFYAKPPLKEPNGWVNSDQEKIAVYYMQKHGNDYQKAWHDWGASAVSKVLCKMPAVGVGAKTKPPPPPQENPPMLTRFEEPVPTVRPTNRSTRKSCRI